MTARRATWHSLDDLPRSGWQPPFEDRPPRLGALVHKPSILPTLLRNLQELLVVSAALRDHPLLALVNLACAFETAACTLEISSRTESTRFLDFSMNIFVALMRASTGRTSACNRAWWRASFNPVTAGSSSPNTLIATSNFPTRPLASEIASSGLRETLS